MARRRTKIIIGAVVAVVVGVLVVVLLTIAGVVALITGSDGDDGAGGSGAGSCVNPGVPIDMTSPVSGTIGQQQIANAKIVAKTITKLGYGGDAILITLVAATGESDLINLNHGDAAGPDSAGILQQRSSWGTREQRMSPAYAATSFLLGPKHDGKPHGPGGTGLVAITGWKTMSISAAIHAVQSNADPNHYTQYISRAKQLAQKAGIDLDQAGAAPDDTSPAAPGADCGGSDPGDVGSAKGLAAAAIKAVKAELGTPYSFGGGTPQGPTVGKTSPAGWDCSSYVQMAYYRASEGKINLPRVTYSQMASPLVRTVDRSDMQPGDLIFIQTGGDGWGHVVMYLGAGKIIEEPHTGEVSRIAPLSEYNGMAQTVRRIKAAETGS